MQSGLDDDRILPDSVLYRQCWACGGSDRNNDAAHPAVGRGIRPGYGQYPRQDAHPLGESPAIDLVDGDPDGAWPGDRIYHSVRTGGRCEDGMGDDNIYPDGGCDLHGMKSCLQYIAVPGSAGSERPCPDEFDTFLLYNGSGTFYQL